MAGATHGCHMGRSTDHRKGRQIGEMSSGGSELKQRKRQGHADRGVTRKSSWKRSVTRKVREPGVKDLGGELEVGSPTSLSTRACAVGTSAL